MPMPLRLSRFLPSSSFSLVTPPISPYLLRWRHTFLLSFSDAASIFTYLPLSPFFHFRCQLSFTWRLGLLFYIFIFHFIFYFFRLFRAFSFSAFIIYAIVFT